MRNHLCFEIDSKPNKLTKEAAKSKFDKLFYIEANNFDPDMLLPALFWLVRARGSDRAGMRIEQINIREKTVRLATHQKVKGFQSVEGERLLDKWVRSSLVQVGRSGRSQQGGEQIAFVRPLSFLAYKPALPTETSRLRLVHQFVYHACKDFVSLQRSGGPERKTFDDLIEEAFAEGVKLEPGNVKEGRYDETTQVDLEALLQMRYMDGFGAQRESDKERTKPPVPACHWAATILARDFTTFVQAYAKRMPAAVLGQHLVCLLNFELCIYTLRLAKAANTLVQDNIAPPEFEPVSREFTPLDLYADLTQMRGNVSDSLAYACVNRDIEAFETYFRSSQMLRTLDRYGVRHPRLKDVSREGGPYMVALNDLREDSRMQSMAALEVESFLMKLTEDANSVIPQEIQFLIDSNLDDLSLMVEIIILNQRKYGINNLLKWYGDVGGIQRPDGILRGNTKGKRAWRYVMSDMLLETLVQLAAVSPDARTRTGAATERADSLTLSDFLRFLRNRYGLLIDTPPAFDRSVEATAAAKENFAALKQRLRQMGLFLDLSDDFNAQRIFPRYMEDASVQP